MSDVGDLYAAASGHPQSGLAAAMRRHKTACDAVLSEPFESWPVGDAMRLIAMMAREIAVSHKQSA